MTNENDDVPTLHEVLQVAKDFGLVGEEQTFLGVILAMVQGGLIVLTGVSRAGKTFTVDRAIDVTGDDDKYEVSGSLSQTALFYDHRRMNKARGHLYPDITELPSVLEATLKQNAEGKPATHRATDVTADDTREFVIEPPDYMVLCVASDNEKFDWNDYPEIRNRAFIWEVDSSEEQTRRIQEVQALMDAGLWETKIDPEVRRQIRAHLRRVGGMVGRYGEGGIGQVINPGAVGLQKQEPIPAKFAEGREDFKRLLKFVHAVALYHFPERMEVMQDGKPTLLVAPVDIWMGMKIFGENLVLSALNLRETDRVILGKLRETNDAYSVSEMQQLLRAEGFNLTDRDVRRSLESMKTKAYVFKNESESPITYQASPFASVAFNSVRIDWAEVVEDAMRVAREVLDPDVAEEYIEQHCTTDGLVAVHPITGDEVNIIEDTEFDEVLEEAEDAMEEVLETPLYGSDQDEDLTAFATAEGGAAESLSGVLG